MAVVLPTQTFVQTTPFGASVRLSGRTTFAYRLQTHGRTNSKSCLSSSSLSRLENEENEQRDRIAGGMDLRIVPTGSARHYPLPSPEGSYLLDMQAVLWDTTGGEALGLASRFLLLGGNLRTKREIPLSENGNQSSHTPHRFKKMDDAHPSRVGTK
jgi:hypothetical protein